MTSIAKRMEYIYQDEDGGWYLDPYFEYLTAVDDKLPPNAQKFVRVRAHFGLFPRNSLHDAWLEHLVIREPASGERMERRSIEIELQLLGSYHDRRIWLTYLNVRNYSFATPADFQLPPFGVGHGDLIIHEVRLSEGGYVEHEILFSRGSTFVIECDDLVHREALLATSP